MLPLESSFEVIFHCATGIQGVVTLSRSVCDEQIIVDRNGPSWSYWKVYANTLGIPFPLTDVRIRGNAAQLSFGHYSHDDPNQLDDTSPLCQNPIDVT